MEETENLENSEETETEVMEFSLIDEEIDELIAKLELLKQTQGSFEFEVDDENSFLIHYEESSEDENDIGEVL